MPKKMNYKTIPDIVMTGMIRDFFKGTGKIFGFSRDALLEVHTQYLLRRGPLDITPESVRKAFGCQDEEML